MRRVFPVSIMPALAAGLAVLACLPVPLVRAADDGNAAPDQVADNNTEVQTRRELWRRKRLERRQRLEPYRAGWLERNLLAIEKAERPSLLEVNLWSFYPRLRTFTRSANLAPGLRFWQPDMGSLPVSVHASAFRSLRGDEFYDLQLGRIPHDHDRRRLPLRSSKGDDVYELGDLGRPPALPAVFYGSLRYRRRPQVDFFGLGPDARSDAHASFLFESTTAELVAGVRWGRHVSLTARPAWLRFQVGSGRDKNLPDALQTFDDRQAPGLDAQPDFLRLGALLLIDLRDEPGNPHKGVLLAAGYEDYRPRDRAPYGFERWAADLRAYLPLGSWQRVLALRARASWDVPRRGQRVPFYLQETLGGSRSLRGFHSSRFRGERLLLLQAEYRWEAAPAVELVLFADAGRVSDDGWRLNGLEADFGAGLRIKTHRQVLLRLDWAHSHETSRLLLRFSDAF